MKYIIIGLGNFGSTLSITLTDMGHEVLGVDINMEKVQAIKDRITHAVCLDSTNQQALETLPLESTDVVIVGIGEDAGASIMATALLKQMNVKRLISRAISPLHQTVLETMNVEEIVQPEREAAQRLATRLEYDEVINSFSLSDRYKIAEVRIPSVCIGKSVMELNLPSQFNIVILTVIRQQARRNLLGIIKPQTEVLGVISAETRLQAGDILVIFGSVDDIHRFIEESGVEE